MKKKLIAKVGVFVLAISVIFVLWLAQNDTFKVKAGRPGPVRDVIGTQTATITAPYGFYAEHDASTVPSTTAVLDLLENTDTILSTIFIKDASTTNELYYDILGSNDDSCGTASSTTVFNDIVTTEQVHWYKFPAIDSDAIGQYQNYATSSSVGSNATGTSFLLTNILWDCLRFEMSGVSSTVVWQIKEMINWQ